MEKGQGGMYLSFKNICMYWCIPDAGNTIFDKDRVLIYHDILGISFLFITSENLIVIFWCFSNLTVSNYHFLFLYCTTLIESDNTNIMITHVIMIKLVYNGSKCFLDN